MGMILTAEHAMRRRRPPIARYLTVALLLGSLTQFASAGLVYAKAWLAPLLIERAFIASQQRHAVVRPWPWADTWPVARLQVPRLSLQRHVLAGDSGEALAFAAGMAPQVRPGDPGLTMISGHRDTHFRFLSKLQVGDTLSLDYEDQRIHYRITDRVVADARDGLIDAVLPARGLLLVTCYPFDALVPGGPGRFVVVAEQIGNEALSLVDRGDAMLR